MTEKSTLTQLGPPPHLLYFESVMRVWVLELLSLLLTVLGRENSKRKYSTGDETISDERNIRQILSKTSTKGSFGEYSQRIQTRKKKRKRTKDESVAHRHAEGHYETDHGKLEGSPSPNPRSVVVSIPGYGKVEGRRDGGVDTFLGIPYAAPPVAALRFAPPEAAQPWAPSRLDASKFSPDCFQIPDPTLNPVVDIHRMSEDCLYLNIFTPAGHAERSMHGFLTSSGTKLLPVMVWLHGGGFQQGGARRAEYDGRRLAGRDIIVVSLNYRLGALGFLVSTSDGLYGNFGLMDQRAAIEWVKRNIKAFGGDDDNITLFGESAGAVMIGMHLLMEGAGSLFHKAIMQSNPLGYTFRSVVIGDFIGEALKRAIDCRDLACLRTEKVEEILRAQRSLMGVPRSVGDFFTWSPSLTTEMKLKISVSNENRFFSKAEEHRLPRIELDQRTSIVSEWRLGGDERTSDSARWSAVNVSQPLQTLGKIPDHIPIMIGTNKHEGEMFVHSAFPAPMPKAVYWMFVGALFRDSASRILRHYRGLVYEVEKQAEDLARKQMEEEENRQFYIENRVQLEAEYEMLLAMNHSRKKEKVEIMSREGLRALVNTWSGLGFSGGGSYKVDNTTSTISSAADKVSKPVLPGISAWSERWKNWTESREEKRLKQMKDKALRDAAKVVVDFRPVMSAIINDYLFRCPSWHFAQSLSEKRSKGKYKNNIFVYRFSQPTHIPGYKECWGKSCHTAELPYVFQSMDVIRSNYSTLGPYAQREARSAPEFPFTQIMAAYRGAIDASDSSTVGLEDEGSSRNEGPTIRNHTMAFQRILNHFFGDYFKEDADEELASDMADRWSSFARNGDPNYEGSKGEWLPWKNEKGNGTFFQNQKALLHSQFLEDIHIPDEEIEFNSAISQDTYDEYEYDFIEDTMETDAVPNSSLSEEQRIRVRALEALHMGVTEEDMFRTELRRLPPASIESAESALFRSRIFFKSNPRKINEQKVVPAMSKMEAKEAIILAQDIGVLGSGLLNHGTDQLFFPELFELSWPPEGRLLERDCTCDLYDNIGYRY